MDVCHEVESHINSQIKSLDIFLIAGFAPSLCNLTERTSIEIKDLLPISLYNTKLEVVLSFVGSFSTPHFDEMSVLAYEMVHGGEDVETRIRRVGCRLNMTVLVQYWH